MVDKDGKYSRSKIIAFYISGSGLHVYPTLTTSGIYIQSVEQKSFYLFNSSGQFIKYLRQGQNDISSLPAGIYLIKNGEEVVRISKQ